MQKTQRTPKPKNSNRIARNGDYVMIEGILFLAHKLGDKTTLYITLKDKTTKTCIIPTKTYNEFLTETDIDPNFPYPEVTVDPEKKTIKLALNPEDAT